MAQTQTQQNDPFADQFTSAAIKISKGVFHWTKERTNPMHKSRIIFTKARISPLIKSGSLLHFNRAIKSIPTPSFSLGTTLFKRLPGPNSYGNQRNNQLEKFMPKLSRVSILANASSVTGSYSFEPHNLFLKRQITRDMTNASIEMKTDKDIVRFNIGNQIGEERSRNKRKIVKKVEISRKKKLNELRFYRLKAKKKMNSPNPEVRMRYKLEKAKRKETWLIEKLRKYELPKSIPETHDPEILTEEERFFLKRTGEKKKHYVPVGRRGVFGGVVLNMHLHWKNHETVKVVCKPCRPGQVHQYAEELARLSKGMVIDIKTNNIILFYRGKNYVQPDVMSPPETLSKAKALEKYRYEQSLEHTSEFIEKLENELEEYYMHVARYKKEKNAT